MKVKDVIAGLMAVDKGRAINLWFGAEFNTLKVDFYTNNNGAMAMLIKERIEDRGSLYRRVTVGDLISWLSEYSKDAEIVFPYGYKIFECMEVWENPDSNEAALCLGNNDMASNLATYFATQQSIRAYEGK